MRLLRYSMASICFESGRCVHGFGTTKEGAASRSVCDDGRLPTSDGHVFYTKLNNLLSEAGFDAWIESICEPYYKGQRSPPAFPRESTSECCSSATLRGFNRNVASPGGVPTAFRFVSFLASHSLKAHPIIRR